MIHVLCVHVMFLRNPVSSSWLVSSEFSLLQQLSFCSCQTPETVSVRLTKKKHHEFFTKGDFKLIFMFIYYRSLLYDIIWARSDV